MAKVGRAAREGARKNILELTSDKTLSATDTGKTILLNSGDALAVTLPDPASSPVGTFYRFIVIAANNNAYTITTADLTDTTGDMFVGSVLYGESVTTGAGASGDDNVSLIVPGANDNRITLDANATHSGGNIGTWIECVRISASQWLVCGTVITADASGNGSAIFSNES